jgi:hypothetical protein
LPEEEPESLVFEEPESLVFAFESPEPESEPELELSEEDDDESELSEPLLPERSSSRLRRLVP